MTATYAQASDVRRILQNSFKFTSATKPTKEDVDASIEEAEDEINQTTQHAWKEITVREQFYNIPPDYWSGAARLSKIDIPIHLDHREIRAFGTARGDKLEVWNGNAYEDWLSTKTEGRESDFWLETEQGILHLNYFWPYFREKAIRLSYRYGGSVVPKDIRKATAFLATIDLVQNDDKSALLAETGDPTRLSHLDRIERMRKKVDSILRNRIEYQTI